LYRRNSLLLGRHARLTCLLSQSLVRIRWKVRFAD
jgi:hypothetical protein